MSDFDEKNRVDSSPDEGTPVVSDEISEGSAAAVVDPAPKKESLISALFDYVEIVIFAALGVFLVFTLLVRLCRVDGNSMRNTLYDGQRIITTTLDRPDRGDIVVFHQTSDLYKQFNEPIVKRVIATEGQTVRIDYNTAKVYVDGQEIDEPYAALLDHEHKFSGQLTLTPSHHYDSKTRIFEVTVPDGHLFVMGDNRNHSADSRSAQVGLVDERRVLGVAKLRVRPFTVFH